MHEGPQQRLKGALGYTVVVNSGFCAGILLLQSKPAEDRSKFRLNEQIIVSSSSWFWSDWS